jgi:hypothetical protein
MYSFGTKEMHTPNESSHSADELLTRTERAVASRYRAIKDLALSDLGIDSVVRGQLDCPSMLPGLARGVIAKVVRNDERLRFLAEEIPVPAALPLAVDSETVLKRARFVGACRTDECGHWTGVTCRLGHAIASVEIQSSSKVAPCAIRSSCRWFKENGSAACAPCQHVRYVPIEVRLPD